MAKKNTPAPTPSATADASGDILAEGVVESKPTPDADRAARRARASALLVEGMQDPKAFLGLKDDDGETPELLDATDPAAAAPAKADDKAKKDDAAKPDKPADKPADDKDPAKAAAAQVSPQLAAIARREREAKRLEGERMAKLEAREKELEAKAAKVELFEKAAARAKVDPVSFFRDVLGINDGFAEIGELFYFEAMGPDKAPADLAARKKQRETDDRIARLEARERELEEREKTAAQRADDERLVADYKGRLRTAVTAIPDAEAKKKDPEAFDVSGFPHVQCWAEQFPDQVVDALYGAAERLAQSAGRKADPAELVAELEKNLASELAIFRKLYPAEKTPDVNTPAAQKTVKPAPTLSSDETAAQTSRKGLKARTQAERLERATRILQEQAP